jgi:hypothetical protein
MNKAMGMKMAWKVISGYAAWWNFVLVKKIFYRFEAEMSRNPPKN